MDRHAALGISHNAPPSSSATFIGGSGQSLASRLKPNLGGRTAFQRERDLSARYGAYDGAIQAPRKTEWDVLKENHRFIRSDEEPTSVSWEERLARAYESQLFKEYALIDLKHYKSKQFALRWRTAPEVVEGLGEDTCAGLRCKYHRPDAPSRREGSGSDGGRRWDSDEDEGGNRSRRKKGKRMPVLRAFELPFRYEEAGESKEALVKVKLCPKCVGKLLWKPRAEGGDAVEEDDREQRVRRDEGKLKENFERRKDHDEEEHGGGSRAHREKERRRDRSRDRSDERRRNNRSRSPRRRNEI